MVSSSVFLFPLLVSCILRSSQASNITLNSSLAANPNDNSSWVSSSGDFAFGFCQLNNTNTFLLAVWYAKIPEKTIVWHAETITPVLTGSKLQLTKDSLAVNSPSGQTIWKAETSSEIVYGSMLDTGNFVLAGTDNDSVYVWESFSYPTDTILPSQTLLPGKTLNSRLSMTNYSRGRFVLRIRNTNLVLFPVGWPGEYTYRPYYNTKLDASESGFVSLFFNQTAQNLYLVKGDGTWVPLQWQGSSPNPNNYYRATLDFDGVFRQYTFLKGSGSDRRWTVIRYIPGDLCTALFDEYTGSGACGLNSYCESNTSQITCSCPPGYSFIDRNNMFGGCRPNFPLGCGIADDDRRKNPEDLYDVQEVQGLDFPFADYESLGPYNQTQCHQSCLTDCMCVAAVFNGMICWKKKYPLTNGRRSGRLLMLKIRKDVSNPPSDNPGTSNTGSNKRVLLWSLLLGTSGFFNMFFLVVISLFVFSRREPKLRRTSPNSIVVPETNLRVFSFEELRDATRGFEDELGRGSFGIVYKGEIEKGGLKCGVAVKKLDKLSPEGEKEFKAEVSAIGRTHHKNLVQLLGYCGDGPHRLLVYEFMSNGSLANFLFNNTKPEWNKRTQVALGIARGLVYLHEECSFPIIHCDIKPQNILIDENFNPRISDFGLAKTLMYNQTRTCTGIRGTRGYIAPEWFKNMPVTIKVDVYSFGVMLLEIICCRKSLEMEFGEDERAILTDWAQDCYRDGRVQALVDGDEEALSDIAALQRWIMTALCCIEEDPSDRPTMKTVIKMLEGS